MKLAAASMSYSCCNFSLSFRSPGSLRYRGSLFHPWGNDQFATENGWFIATKCYKEGIQQISNIPTSKDRSRKSPPHAWIVDCQDLASQMWVAWNCYLRKFGSNWHLSIPIHPLPRDWGVRDFKTSSSKSFAYLRSMDSLLGKIYTILLFNIAMENPL